MLKLAAEKNLNKFAFPVFSIKGRPVNYSSIYKYSDYGFACDSGRLGANNWMILDLLGTIIIQSISRAKDHNPLSRFQKRIPTQRDVRIKNSSSHHISHTDLVNFLREISELKCEQIPEDLCRKDFSDNSGFYQVRAICPNVTIRDTEIKERLPLLKKYSSLDFHDLLYETAALKVKMKYPIRFYDRSENKYFNFDFNNYGFSSSFFRIINCEKTKLSSNGHVLERLYTIRFDTVLGYFFVQNYFSAYVDLLPMKFYDMSDYAQLYYRILVLPFYNGIKDNLNIEQIRQRLGLKTKDRYMLRKVINRILKELEDNSFISPHSETMINGTYVYSYSKTPWKEIEK